MFRKLNLINLYHFVFLRWAASRFEWSWAQSASYAYQQAATKQLESQLQKETYQTAHFQFTVAAALKAQTFQQQVSFSLGTAVALLLFLPLAHALLYASFWINMNNNISQLPW